MIGVLVVGAIALGLACAVLATRGELRRLDEERRLAERLAHERAAADNAVYLREVERVLYAPTNPHERDA